MNGQSSRQVADWFEHWFGSPYYHILYQNRDEAEANQFIVNLMAYLKPLSGATMLDIACGEGRFAKQLAELGFDVTGIDLSERSIAIAQEAEQENLHFLVQDMRFLFYINHFDFAFNFFTSFGYFRYNRDNRQAAKAFGAALKQGGVLVIDYLNCEYVIKNLVREATVQRADYTFQIKKRLEGKQIIKEIFFTDADHIKRHYVENVSAFTLPDFEQLFSQAGLTLEATFGDYSLNPYQPESSPRLILVFRKN
jgi:SAM-dependent methyltransferase